MTTHAQLEHAKLYIENGIKEGYCSPEDFENLTDEEYVLKARELEDKSDAYEDSFLLK